MKSLVTSFIGLIISIAPSIISISLTAAGLADSTMAYLLDRWFNGIFALNLILAVVGIPVTLIGLRSFRKESRKRARLFSWRESTHESEITLL